MASKEEEFKEIFSAEALENYEDLNRLFTLLEKNHNDKSSVEAIFRITHTLKANAAAMGFDAIAQLAHIMEDIFSEIKSGSIEMTATLFNDLFRANDKLGELIQAIKTDEKIRYKGMITKLKVILRKEKPAEETPQPPAQKPVPPSNPNPQDAPPANDPFQDAGANTSTPEINPDPFGGFENPPSSETPPVAPLSNDGGGETVAVPQPVAEEVAVEELPEEETVKSPKITFSDVVSVPVKKLDQLLNLVGELAIEKDRIVATSSRKGSGNDHAGLHRITSDLQYSVMGVRLVQVSVLFHKFHRIVRDVALLEKKEINLVLEGTEIEIDRNVLQTISDSMIHLVRNAVSHGIEPPQARQQVGKTAYGNLVLKARNDKDHVVIDIIDDGKGINPAIIKKKAVEKGVITMDQASMLTEDEAVKLIFEPGFSSADSVTAVSGRGVGMDVVKKSIDSIGGKINIQTDVGKGTTFSLSLPSSMAVKSVLLFELRGAEFAIPLSYNEAVISLYKKQIRKAGNGLISTYLDKTISLIYLNDIFGKDHLHELKDSKMLHESFEKTREDEKLNIILVSSDNKLVGIVVDKLMQQKEIIEKPLRPPVENVRFISGATIMGNGNVCLVVDVPSIVEFLFRTINQTT